MPQQDEERASLCYFLVCFNNSEFVAFLLASLYRERDLFIVHCDVKAPQTLKNYLHALSARYDNVFIFPSRDYSWAGFSHVQITLEAMRDALQRTQTWTHFIALSEQHLPLKSPSQIASFLATRKSMLDMRSAKQMGGAENHDIGNRFAAYYRELPGVGCFALKVADRRDLLEKVHHGTNWFAIHRTHCEYLVNARSDGAFDPFESVLDSEETAIQTFLAPIKQDIEQHDATLVALPQLTDNHSLVMNDHLFAKGLNTNFLFIRKRTRELSSFVRKHVLDNHFDFDVYNLLSRSRPEEKPGEQVPDAVDVVAATIRSSLEASEPDIVVARISAREFDSTPKIHLIVKHPTLLTRNMCVRVLSENLSDFKILIDKEQRVPDSFVAPFVRNGFLHSTIRSRIHGLFGYEEILPLSESDHGFVTLGSGRTITHVISTAGRFLRAALMFCRNDGLAEHSASATVTSSPTDERSREPMPRPQRLNALAQLTEAKRYLEVGVCHGETFFEVDIPYKVAVDLNFRFDYEANATTQTIFHQVSSDEYFSGAEEAAPFDLIYLDGLHTFEQTLRDLLNSMKFAHDRTVWLLDDTVPSNVFAALPSEHECWVSRGKVGIEDWSWMGDVYKVVFFVSRMMPFFRFRTFSGHGQTVIWKGKTARPIPSTPTYSADEIGTMTYASMIRLLDEMLITPDAEILQAIRADLCG